MKINDYDLHKKLQYLTRWCKPGVKYSFNERGLIKINKVRTSCGSHEITMSDVKELWFCIDGGNFITKWGQFEISSITSSGDIGLVWPAIAVGKITLDTNNLTEL